MGQQWAAAIAAAHPDTGTARQQAAQALPSTIVLEADCTRPRAQAGEDRKTQGLLTRGACPGEGVNGFGFWSYSFPGIPKIITLVPCLFTHPPSRQPFATMPQSVHGGKGPFMTPQSTTPTTNTRRPFLLDSALCRPVSRVTLSHKPPGEVFLATQLHLHRCYITERVNKAPRTMAGIQQALNTCLERTERKQGSIGGQMDGWTPRQRFPAAPLLLS